ncbi:MAG: hypothetical protein L3K14_06305 [Thermoplasmata archaeon]|nr:hypothetical protein [Thermoplasmata archaeon]
MDVLQGVVAILLAGINAALAGTLLVIYLGVYRRVRSSFGLGLVIFSAAFTAQNVLSALTYLLYMELVPDVLTPFLLLASAVQTGALAVMVATARI